MFVPDIQIARAEAATWYSMNVLVAVPGQDMVDEDWASLVNLRYM